MQIERMLAPVDGSARTERAIEATARAAGVSSVGVLGGVARVERAIIAPAESQRCELVVMVTRRRGALGEFLFGSQTKAALADCRLPRLVLH